MLWWLQQVSWREGSLELFAKEFLAANRARIGTPAMHKLGLKPGRIYNADEVQKIRMEIGPDAGAGEIMFPLQGESSMEMSDYILDDMDSGTCRQKAYERSQGYPTHYPAQAFLDACARGVAEFPGMLKWMLADPGMPTPRSGLWYLPGFWEALCAWRQRECDAAREKITETAVTRSVFEELDFALETRGFVLIEGREGIGKSAAARAWCGQRPGQAIYVSLESGTDEATLFRSIARRIGTASSCGFKSAEMRTRIQDALQPGHLMLVLDEAHFLWPQNARSEHFTPKRLDWLRTALIDFEVPVALLSTPQYFTQACDRFRKHGWNAHQIQRRLARTTVLPETLSAEDSLAVAQRYFPSLSRRDAKRVAGVALLTLGYLSSIFHLRKRVDFLANRRADATEAELVRIALSEIANNAGGPFGAPEKAHTPVSQRPCMGLAEDRAAPGRSRF